MHDHFIVFLNYAAATIVLSVMIVILSSTGEEIVQLSAKITHKEEAYCVCMDHKPTRSILNTQTITGSDYILLLCLATVSICMTFTTGNFCKDVLFRDG